MYLQKAQGSRVTEDFKRVLSNGWRVSEPYAVEKNTAYRLRMYDESILAGHPPPKELPVFKSEEEKQAYIFEMQQPSTKAALLAQKDRNPEDDLEYLLRPIPPEYLANPNATTQDELTAMRPLKPDEIQAHLSTKKNRNMLGESKDSSIKDKRSAGIHAFTYSKPYEPTVEELKKLTKSAPIDSVAPEFRAPVEQDAKPETLLSRAVYWLQSKLPEWMWK